MEKRLVVDIDLPDDFMVGDCVKCPFYKSNSRMWCPFLEKYHVCPLHWCLMNIPNVPAKEAKIKPLLCCTNLDDTFTFGVMNKINEIIDVLNERN